MAKRSSGDFRKPVPSELDARAQRETDKELERVRPMSSKTAEIFGGVPNGIGRKN